MKNMTPRNIAAACGGKPVNCGSILDTEVSAVTTDSRTVTPGCLYIPIKGETFDGHDFIAKAREAGALLVLTENRTRRGTGLLSGSRIPGSRSSESRNSTGKK